MRRGCITVDEFPCDSCGRTIKHPEGYLALDKDDILPQDDILERLPEERYSAVKGKRSPIRICTNCSLDKGYAHHRTDKGDKVLTIFEKTVGK